MFIVYLKMFMNSKKILDFSNVLNFVKVFMISNMCMSLMFMLSEIIQDFTKFRVIVYLWWCNKMWSWPSKIMIYFFSRCNARALLLVHTNKEISASGRPSWKLPLKLPWITSNASCKWKNDSVFLQVAGRCVCSCSSIPSLITIEQEPD